MQSWRDKRANAVLSLSANFPLYFGIGMYAFAYTYLHNCMPILSTTWIACLSLVHLSRSKPVTATPAAACRCRASDCPPTR